jgi:hypothetical protein
MSSYTHRLAVAETVPHHSGFDNDTAASKLLTLPSALLTVSLPPPQREVVPKNEALHPTIPPKLISGLLCNPTVALIQACSFKYISLPCTIEARTIKSKKGTRQKI